MNDQFDNKTRTKNICQNREKVSEKLGKERDSLSKQVEEANTRINLHVLKIAAEKSEYEDRKISAARAHSEERARQRRHMLNKRMRLLREWRGPWHTEKESKFEPLQIMDWQNARPFLKIQSDSFRPYIKQEHLEIKNNTPNILNEYSSLLLRKETDFSEEEAERLTNSDPSEDLSSTLNKPKQESPLASILSRDSFVIQVEVGIISVLTVRYGILQIITSKKEQKIRFIYDPNYKMKLHANVDMFDYSPSPSKSFIKEWNIDAINTVFPKTYVMRSTAAEFFFADGRSVLINFSSPKERFEFVAQVKKIKKTVAKLEFFKKHNPGKFVAESGMTEK